MFNVQIQEILTIANNPVNAKEELFNILRPATRRDNGLDNLVQFAMIQLSNRELLIEIKKINLFERLIETVLALLKDFSPTSSNPRYLATILHKLAYIIPGNSARRLAINQEIQQIIKNLLFRLSTTPERVTAQGYANALWGLGLFFATSSPATDEIFNTAKLLFEKYLTCTNTQSSTGTAAKRLNSKSDLMHICQITQSLAFLGIPIPDEIKQQLLELKPNSSEIHQSTSRLLTQHNFGHENEKLILGAFFVDLFFPTSNTIVEIDGPEHQNVSSKGFDTIRDDLLVKKGFSIVRIPLTEAFNSENIFQKIVGKLPAPCPSQAPIPSHKNPSSVTNIATQVTSTPVIATITSIETATTSHNVASNDDELGLLRTNGLRPRIPTKNVISSAQTFTHKHRKKSKKYQPFIKDEEISDCLDDITNKREAIATIKAFLGNKKMVPGNDVPLRQFDKKVLFACISDTKIHKDRGCTFFCCTCCISYKIDIGDLKEKLEAEWTKLLLNTQIPSEAKVISCA